MYTTQDLDKMYNTVLAILPDLIYNSKTLQVFSEKRQTFAKRNMYSQARIQKSLMRGGLNQN